ncbi:MAG: hypothetical protein R6V67_06810 [Spirochaetia bacterium]
MDLRLLQEENTLFTAGEDGSVRKWDLDSQRLIKKLQISHLPVVDVALHPQKPLIALVETDRINTYHLSVWNYETEEELYSHKISEIPLFLRFSPKGSFLVYGMTDWESLTFLESETGNVKPLFAGGFGIVSAAFISDTERTLLTYSPSGRIQYWDLTTGEQRGTDNRIQTVSDLRNIRFIPGGRYLIGFKRSTLYMIDLVSGKTVDSRDVENIDSFSIDEDGSFLTVLDGSSSRARFSHFSLNTSGSGTRGFTEEDSFTIREKIGDSIAFDGREVYFGTREGSIFSRSLRTEETVLFASPNILDIHDIAFSQDMIFLSSEDRFFSITSNAFTSIEEEDDASGFSFSSDTYSNPVSERAGLISLEDGECILYPEEEQRGGYKIYRFSDGDFSSLYDGIDSAVETGTTYNDDLLFLEKNGSIKIISPEDGSSQFSYTSFGLRSISRVQMGNLIASRNKTDFIDTPLLHINPNTGETVPIDDTNILTFHLQYDDTTRNLYTLGYEQRANGLRTVLKQHAGSNYDRVTTLLSYPGEDPEATLAVDPVTSKIFTSLGYGKVHMYAWNGFTYLEPINHISRKLYVHDGFLYSLNEDSSISVWDTDKGTLLMTIYVFNDYSWAVIPREGEPYTYGDADKYLHTVK